MKRDNINYVVVGAFVLAVGVAFLILLFAITGRSGPQDEYYTYYRNVSGLKFGTGVFYEGFRVGQIESIEPEGEGANLRYKVELSVTRDWKIPTDSAASIAAGGLIAAMTIDIDGGTSAQYIPVGGEIPGSEAGNLFANLNQLATDLRPVLATLGARVNDLADEYVALRREDLSPFVKMLNERTAEILQRTENVLSDQNQQAVTSILSNVDVASADLVTLVKNVESTRAVLHEISVGLNDMLKTNRPGIDAAVTDLQQALASLDSVLDTVEERIDAIVYHLEGSAQNLHEFSRVIRANPGTLLRGTGATEEAGVGE